MAVSKLEALYGTKWRSDSAETRFFNRRKIVIDEIKRLVSSKEYNNHSDAVKSLDDWMIINKKSLSKLQAHIRPVVKKACSNNDESESNQ